jgi:hypothetical protein
MRTHTHPHWHPQPHTHTSTRGSAHTRTRTHTRTHTRTRRTHTHICARTHARVACSCTFAQPICMVPARCAGGASGCAAALSVPKGTRGCSRTRAMLILGPKPVRPILSFSSPRCLPDGNQDGSHNVAWLCVWSVPHHHAVRCAGSVPHGGALRAACRSGGSLTSRCCGRRAFQTRAPLPSDTWARVRARQRARACARLSVRVGVCMWAWACLCLRACVLVPRSLVERRAHSHRSDKRRRTAPRVRVALGRNTTNPKPVIESHHVLKTLMECSRGHETPCA